MRTHINLGAALMAMGWVFYFESIALANAQEQNTLQQTPMTERATFAMY